MANKFTLSDSSVALLFKKKYLKYQENVANRTFPTLSKVKKTADFVGEELQKTIDLGWIGGAGAGDIPLSNRGIYIRPTLTSKSLYVTAEVNRRSVKQSKDPGSFVEGQKHMVQKVTEKFTWLRNFALWGTDANGRVAVIDGGGVTDNGSGNYSLVLAASTYNRTKVEVREIVNIGSASTDKFEITSHDPSTRTVVVQRLTGSTVPVAADELYIQGGYGAFPTGIPYALGRSSASAHTLYGTSIQYRYEAYRKDASSAGISVDLLNELMLSIHQQCGKSPTVLAVGYVQMRKLLDLIEDQKRYFTEGKVSNRSGDFSFNAIQFMSVDGPVPIVLEPFVEDNRVYALNPDYIEEHSAPDTPGWVDDDTGSIWLRKATDDFEARYAWYGDNLILPHYHGYIHTLAT